MKTKVKIKVPAAKPAAGKNAKPAKPAKKEPNYGIHCGVYENERTGQKFPMFQVLDANAKDNRFPAIQFGTSKAKALLAVKDELIAALEAFVESNGQSVEA
jgi:hypothetical protein